MAKATFSGIGITEMRNKLGDEVHFRNRGGSVVRAYASPVVNPNTIGLEFREIYGDLCEIWQLLDDSTRLEWNMFASSQAAKSVGIHKRHLSGFNWFVKQSVGILITGNVPSFLPVVPIFTVNPTALFVLTLSTTQVELKVTGASSDTIVPPNTYLALFASAGVSPGITSKKTGINAVTIYSPGTDSESLDISSEYISQFGAPVVGRKIFFGACTYSSLSGSKSYRITTSAIVE